VTSIRRKNDIAPKRTPQEQQQKTWKKEKEKDDDRRLLQGLEQLLKLKRVCKKRSDGLWGTQEYHWQLVSTATGPQQRREYSPASRTHQDDNKQR
jgi:hypothetical protein